MERMIATLSVFAVSFLTGTRATRTEHPWKFWLGMIATSLFINHFFPSPYITLFATGYTCAAILTGLEYLLLFAFPH